MMMGTPHGEMQASDCKGNAMTATMLLFLACQGDILVITHKYVRPQGDGYTLESEVTSTPRGGRPYVSSRTVRGNLTLHLVIGTGRPGLPTQATITLQQGEKMEKATAVLADGVAKITRPSGVEEVKVGPNPIITSAPDWTDIFVLCRRYDDAKGGKQEFPGLWFHPTQKTLTPTFTIEKKGTDTIKLNDAEQKLTRFEIRLRASTNTVWRREDGLVVKILPAGDKATPVILQGYEKATSGLK